MYAIPIPNAIPGEWSSGLCSCLENGEICFMGMCCPMMIAVNTHNDLSNIPYEPVDKCCGCVQSMASLYWVGLLFTGYGMYQTRNMVMQKHGIKEDSSCLKSYMCLPCSACQIQREMESRRKLITPPNPIHRM